MSDDPHAADIDFVSMLTHQLSTPVAGIHWAAELLRMGTTTKPLDEEQAKLADEILVGLSHLGEFISDLHDSSWLERHKFADTPRTTSLTELLAQIQSQRQAEITKKRLKFSVQADPSLPNITARPSTLSLILQNLMSNAIKYTAEGGSVQVALRPATGEEAAKAKTQNGGEYIFLSVTDTGIGIPAAQQNRVFSKLFRADNAASLDVSGTGLGLYIVDLAVADLGGAVWFTSAENQGSSFSAVLPVSDQPGS